MAEVLFQVWRGNASGGGFKDYRVPVTEGWVVLDAIHWIQANAEPDLAVRWNCKAGKCGSCSAEINGKPRLMCMNRLEDAVVDGKVTVEPMKTFPSIKDLVTDVSWNYEVKKRIKPLNPQTDAAGNIRMQQMDVDRIQEFRKCIECYLCQNVCHVLRDHDEFEFGGPRFLIHAAQLEMHPLDQENRLETIKDVLNIGYCNITKCCSEVCPEHIHITDNGIIPLKERVVGEYYDPLAKMVKNLFGWKQEPQI